MNNQYTDFETIFQSLPGNYLILKPDSPHFTIAAASDSYIEVTFTKREDIIGKSLFDVFHDNPDDFTAAGSAKLTASLETVIKERKPDEMPLHRYDLLRSNGNGFEIRYWQLKNFPVFDASGNVIYIIHTAINATEQVEARRQIEELKLDQKAYDLFMQAQVAIAITKNDNYTIELANTSFLELIGRKTDVIGKPILEALPEIEGQGFIELMDLVKTSGKPYHANEIAATLIRSGKEEVLYTNFVYQPYFEPDYTISGVMIVASDVTEQVNARKKIEESEQRLHNLIAEATVATGLYIGKEMKIQYANEAMLKLWGKDKEVIGKNLRDALPELDGQPFHELLTNVYTTGETYWGKEDLAQLVVDGKLQDFFFNFTYKALRNFNGEIYGILNMAVDVTEQVVAKQRLVESEASSRLAIEAAHLGTYAFNLLSQTVIHSQRTAEIFGYDPSKKLTVCNLLKSLHPGDLPIREAACKVATKTGQLLYEARIILPDNSMRWIRVNGKHWLEKGTPAFTIGTIMDITDEKKSTETMEEKIRKRTKELEEANQMLKRTNSELEQFANAASHDLKEPLRKIRTFNQLIKKESYEILSDRSKKHLDKSSESAERMSAFLDALLDYTQLKNADIFTPIDLNTVLSDVLTDLELVISEKTALVNIEHLPIINGISHQLHQLFYNLLNNALKFSKPDVSPVIEITSRKPDITKEQHANLKQGKRYVEILVKDNGIGFNQKFAEQIFTIFQRLHNKSAYTGTGIGLALCKKVVLNHFGEIYAISSPDYGSVFYIVLPIT